MSYTPCRGCASPACVASGACQFPHGIELKRVLSAATADPGAYVGYRGDRGMGMWMADSVVQALDEAGFKIVRK
jgi:hypothetical protein